MFQPADILVRAKDWYIYTLFIWQVLVNTFWKPNCPIKKAFHYNWAHFENVE